MTASLTTVTSALDIPDLPDRAALVAKEPRGNFAALGVTKADGTPLERDNVPASIVLPQGRGGPAFLAFPNFDVYLTWNNSLVYALTAGYFGTRLAALAPGALAPRALVLGVMALAFVGSVAGALVATQIPKSAFDPIVLVVLVVVGGYVLLKPSIGEVTTLRFGFPEVVLGEPMLRPAALLRSAGAWWPTSPGSTFATPPAG